MNRRLKGFAAFGAVVVLGLTAFAITSTAAKRVQHIGVSTQPSTSKQQGKKGIVVTGELVSSVPRCERQRSVLLYEANQAGDFLGGAIGHGVSDGSGAKGEFTIVGRTNKKISPTREFRLEAVARNVKIKGQEKICKRGVSIGFRATYP